MPPTDAATVVDQETLLAEDDRRLHRTLIDPAPATGSIPSACELAHLLATSEDAIRAGLAALAVLVVARRN